MTAFDPATIQLQRDLLDKNARDLDRDRRLLDKLPMHSKSKMAQTLRERIATGENVAGDLAALIRFMEGLNREGDAPACCLAAEQFEHDKNCETRLAARDAESEAGR